VVDSEQANAPSSSPASSSSSSLSAPSSSAAEFPFKRPRMMTMTDSSPRGFFLCSLLRLFPILVLTGLCRIPPGGTLL